jgi:hypothetical protein
MNLLYTSNLRPRTFVRLAPFTSSNACVALTSIGRLLCPFPTLRPSAQVIHHWRSPRCSNDDPDALLIAVIDLLMLLIRWDESPVAWEKILSLVRMLASGM